jgi:hypothetical protein
MHLNSMGHMREVRLKSAVGMDTIPQEPSHSARAYCLPANPVRSLGLDTNVIATDK